jgi:carboxymethylenebutenolidase
MPTSRIDTITALDGGTFAGHVSVPDSGSGPGVLLLQEIFGVNEFLLSKAADLASAGYVVLCPDVFWRIQPGVALTHDEAALNEAFSLVGRFTSEVPDTTKIADLGAALGALRGLPEVTGKVAAMGYCLGGHLAYVVAAYHGPDACVSYYGSGIAGRLAEATQITCPVLFHFGGSDPFIANEEVEAVRAAFADRTDVEVVVEAGAGHAFENFLADQFHDPDATARSWPRTVQFLRHTIGP